MNDQIILRLKKSIAKYDYLNQLSEICIYNDTIKRLKNKLKNFK